ncbi:MAG: CsgG/HfaB family protein, partial [Synergistota bacterium]|nr:CsgG/HfaB family protein [Synergistota bacterium]
DMFTIVERDRIDALLMEQSLVMSGTIDPTSAVQLGKVLGVQAIITGSITEFRHEAAGGALPLPSVPGGVAVGSHTAYVTIDTRAINAQTGEIMMVAREEGASNQTLGGVAYEGAVFGGGKVGGVMAAATHKAVTKLVEKFMELPACAPAVAASYNVLQAMGPKVVIDAGSNNADLEYGDMLAAYREGEAIVAMDGTVLDAEKIYLAILSVVEVKPQYTTCQVVRGIPLERGDKAETLGDRTPDSIVLGAR